jgi:hypothetical protein
MPRLFCALMLLMAAASASLAQDAGTVPPAVVKALAPTGKLRAAINVSNIVLAQRDAAGGTPRGRDIALPYLLGFVEEMKAAGFVAAALKRSNQPDATVAPPAGN